MIQLMIQTAPFDTSAIIDSLFQSQTDVGAVVTFSGVVREFLSGETSENLLQGIELECYESMTYHYLEKICREAQERWGLSQIYIVHRVGFLKLSEPIVFVGVSGAHRHQSFDGCCFLMDQLKAFAPFWKKEVLLSGESHWVIAKEYDLAHAQKWCAAR
jgi:molybdopterin synthase catalytic subunit